jgi:hypothetical protein
VGSLKNIVPLFPILAAALMIPAAVVGLWTAITEWRRNKQIQSLEVPSQVWVTGAGWPRWFQYGIVLLLSYTTMNWGSLVTRMLDIVDKCALGDCSNLVPSADASKIRAGWQSEWVQWRWIQLAIGALILCMLARDIIRLARRFSSR